MKKKPAKSSSSERQPRRRSTKPPEPAPPPAAALTASDPVAAESGGLKNRVVQLQTLVAQAVTESRPELAAAIVDELLVLDDARLSACGVETLRRVLAIAETLIPTDLFDPLERLYRKLIPLLRRHADSTTADCFLPLNSLLHLYGRKKDSAASTALVHEIMVSANQLTTTIDSATAAYFTHLAQRCEDSGQHAWVAILRIKLANFSLRGAEPNPELCVTESLKAADSLALANQPDPGIQHLRSLLAVTKAFPGFNDGHRLQILAKLASLAQQRGDGNEARNALEHACAIGLQTDPRYADLAGVVFYNLASFYLGNRIRDRLEEAERLVQLGREQVGRRANRLSDEYASYLNLQAQIVVARGEPERAASICDEAISIYRQAPDTDRGRFETFLTFAGLLHLSLKRAPDAIAAFESALALFDSSGVEDPRRRPDRVADLATAHFQHGDMERAIALYEQAVEMRFSAPPLAAPP